MAGVKREKSADEAALEVKWSEAAKRILRAEMARKGVSVAQLVELLNATGMNENQANLANKIARGGFSSGFFVQCLAAIGAHSVQIAT